MKLREWQALIEAALIAKELLETAQEREARLRRIEERKKRREYNA